MKSILHTKEQGMRVHKLANLGGLVAIAGLENIDTALLLGTFLSIATQLPNLPLQQIELLRMTGLKTLSERNSKKRAYQPHVPDKSSSDSITLKTNDIKLLISKLGGKVPVLEKDFIPELRRLMR